MYKFKLRRGRLKEKEFCYNVLRDGIAPYENIKDKVTLDELSEIVYLFFEEMNKCVVEEKFGVELPVTLGYIQISGIKETAYKIGASPSKLGKAVVNPNYHTDGYVFRAWYRFTNTDNLIKSRVGVYPNASLYKFKSCKSLKVNMTKKIKDNEWKHWGRVEGSRQLFAKSSSAIKIKK